MKFQEQNIEPIELIEKIEQSAQSEERRGFLRIFAGGALAVYFGSALYVVWRFLVSPLGKRIVPPPMRLNVDEISQARHITVKFGDKTVLIRHEAAANADVPCRAFNLRCTHAGCTVDWKTSEQKFVCPCHGAEFRADGSVSRLPAIEPLEELTVERVKGVVVLIDKKREKM